MSNDHFRHQNVDGINALNVHAEEASDTYIRISSTFSIKRKYVIKASEIIPFLAGTLLPMVPSLKAKRHVRCAIAFLILTSIMLSVTFLFTSSVRSHKTTGSARNDHNGSEAQTSSFELHFLHLSKPLATSHFWKPVEIVVSIGTDGMDAQESVNL
ncbi:hypothetical protein KP509_24G066500 [Ceratopteris richardii]|uniref:Transmembrane protein n=1 Tax=Ceratopteris richardii TaxID=49495 RepID=A0A8T2RVW9_CERRI|nr:hypothetical protein KP509_24G066500 [Ceratopteris richardii]